MHVLKQRVRDTCSVFKLSYTFQNNPRARYRQGFFSIKTIRKKTIAPIFSTRQNTCIWMNVYALTEVS